MVARWGVSGILVLTVEACTVLRDLCMLVSEMSSHSCLAVLKSLLLEAVLLPIVPHSPALCWHIVGA